MAAVVAAVIGVIAFWPRNHSVTTTEKLTKVRSFLANAKNVSWTGTYVNESSTGTPRAEASIKSEAKLGSVGQATLVDGKDVLEQVVASGGEFYLRAASSTEKLSSTAWRKIALGASDVRSQVIVPLVDWSQPLSLPAAGRATADTDSKGHLRLSWTVDRAQNVLTVDADGTGKPKRWTLQTTGLDGGRTTLTADHLDWSKGASTAVPTAAQASWVSDGSLSNWNGPLVRPSALPADWKARAARVLPAVETAELQRQVAVVFAPDLNADAYVVIFILPKGTEVPKPSTATAVDGRPSQDWLQVQEDGTSFAFLHLADANVEVTTNLSSDQIPELVKDWVTLELAD